ncbi:MAG: tRNA (adenosine(37)-N6)-threonylcarbamoyltransferase complex ATPase subunit type 1 TsaE [Patescibacteria group bacterium]
MRSYNLFSSVKTKKFAGVFSKEILKIPLSNQALVITLSGDLGAGKTTFARGFLRSAGVKSKITSPTFTLIKNYKITKLPNYKKIYHIDCYRIYKPKELIDLGLKELFENQKNIILIEWPEKIQRTLPKNIIKVKFKYGKKENERIIIIK